MTRSDSISALMAALRKAQKEFPEVKRDAINPHFRSRYATLDGVIDTLQPTLDANGLVISQPAVADPATKSSGVRTILFHETGEFIEEVLLLPNAGPGKDGGDAQQATAAITYARRTGYLSILGIAAEDDDGNTATGKPGTSTSRPTNPPQKGSGANQGKTTGQTPSGTIAVPPKAEIPNGTAPVTPSPTGASVPKTESAPSTTAGTSADPAASTGGKQASSDTPLTETEVAAYHKSFKTLGDDLASAGLKSSRGLPINRKVLAYLLKITGAPSSEKITRTQWNTFFKIAGSVNIKELVTLVDEVTSPKEEIV